MAIYGILEDLKTRSGVLMLRFRHTSADCSACGNQQGDAAFFAKALGDISRDKGMTRVSSNTEHPRKTSARLFRKVGVRHLLPFSVSLPALGLRLRVEASADPESVG